MQPGSWGGRDAGIHWETVAWAGGAQRPPRRPVPTPGARDPSARLMPAPRPLQVGWMMWNWLVSALATGAAVVLYDGSPLLPTPGVLWDLVDRVG